MGAGILKKLLILVYLGTIFTAAGSVFAQEMAASSYVAENYFGRITYIFAKQEADARQYYNLSKDIFEENRGFFIYRFDDPSEHRQELISIFTTKIEQFFYDWRYNPETFTVITGVEESQITEHQLSILSMDIFNVITGLGFIEHLNFVFLSTSYGEVVLFCNIRG